MRPRHLFVVVVIMALFGSAYPVGKLAVGHFPPFLFAAMRSTALALALLPLWRLRPPAPGRWRALAGFCLCMGVGVYAGMYVALDLARTVSPIIIGTQLSVPFAVILGRAFLGETVRAVTWAAIVAAFGGILLIAFEPALLGDIAALATIALSALFYALATLFARSLRDVPAFTMNGWMAVTAIAPLALLSLVLEHDQWRALATAGPAQWGVLLHSAIVVSLLGHVWMFTLYRHYPVAHVIPFYVLMPVFGIGLTLLVFAEVPSVRTLAGGAVVVLAAWAVNRTTSGGPAPATAALDPEPLEYAPDPSLAAGAVAERDG